MILLTIYNDNYLWKNFYYNLFFIPALPHYCCLFFAFFLCFFLFFVSILFSFSPFFSLILLLFSLFFMLFRLVIRFFSLYLVLFLYIYIYFSSIFHHFPINLFFLIDTIYISVYDYIYNKIPNIIYK